MIKYTVRLILFDQPNDRGWKPVYIRITINRKRSYIATGHFLPSKVWDEKNERVKDSHPGAGDLNMDITTRKQQVIKAIVQKQVKGESATASQIKDSFRGNLHNIFDFCDSFVKEVKNKRRQGTLNNYEKHLKVLREYHGSRDLTFEEITREYLVDFEEHLRAKVGANYIYIIWKTLKTFFNAARKRGIITVYPFDNYENPEYTAPVKDYLTLAELDKLEEIADTTTDNTIRQTAVYALLGCYSGLRLSDWLQFDYDKHVRDGQIFLRANKNGEDIVMPIMERLGRALDRVKVTPLTIVEQVLNRTLKEIARMMGTGKKLTTHCCRHSFAITMCAEQGISSETCAELMGIAFQTCAENYYRVTKKKIRDEVTKAWS
ncbi:MAG TPA: site-specific integrase [Ferruginibacter sp.]|jgi:site-specific recombinase XerD|nr:site-specific integrase [Ferruginibacter sp.]